MNKIVVAIYDDIVVARRVVEDLVNADFARNSISLVTNDAHNQYSHYLEKGYIARDDAVTASEVAGFGAVVGGLMGTLFGLAALTMPDIGLAIAVGPIVAGLTGALAGAIAGGIVGTLLKSGVPEDEAPYYAEGIRRGGTLISVQTSDTLRAEDIMNRQGSINVHERINLWRRGGWKGFNAEPESVKDEGMFVLPPVMLTTTTTYAATIGTIPITPKANPITVEPFLPVIEEEPPINDEDTEIMFPVMVTALITDTTISATPIPTVLSASQSR